MRSAWIPYPFRARQLPCGRSLLNCRVSRQQDLPGRRRASMRQGQTHRVRPASTPRATLAVVGGLLPIAAARIRPWRNGIGQVCWPREVLMCPCEHWTKFAVIANCDLWCVAATLAVVQVNNVAAVSGVVLTRA